ncbi:MAG: hypothetical protein WCJ67_05560 [Thermoleophilia bacterium]
MAATAALALVPAALADIASENALAQKYAPVVRLVDQPRECGRGEPYIPIDVDLLFDEPTVVLRGPWNPVDLVKIGPAATDLANRYEYHLDFPGAPLSAGCHYERWARWLAKGSPPTAYAHVATDPGYPGKLALQYWFFYPFNDFNNLHEGDWEMIQLVFDAADPNEALATSPSIIGYSSHEGAEKAAWSDRKLTVVDGTHPVVYPSSGSHANKFSPALYLGDSAAAGVGCDLTQGLHRELKPVVKTIPSDAAAARTAYPWIAFEGRWGELQPAFFNGPLGPNLRAQWTHPIAWSQGWRHHSYEVPSGGILGTGATDLFCGGVQTGSKVLVLLLRSPVLMVLVIVAILALIAAVIVRATWLPVAPLRIARRRTQGQILSSSASMYVRRFRLFLSIGLLQIPIALGVTLIEWLLFRSLDDVVAATGQGAGACALLVFVVGTASTLIGLGLVQATVVCALVEIDAGRPVGPLHAYRIALRRSRPLCVAVALFVGMWVALSVTAFLLPVAVLFAVRWCLFAPVVEVEGTSGAAALRRSRALIRGRWIRTVSLVGGSIVLALLVGPLLGVMLIVGTNMPFVLLDIVAGLVYSVVLPFVALVTAYVYFDARARGETEPADERRELPAEIDLGGNGVRSSSFRP